MPDKDGRRRSNRILVDTNEAVDAIWTKLLCIVDDEVSHIIKNGLVSGELGKTHALTLLYHLANNGPKAKGWLGVSRLLQVAGLNNVPAAAVAAFVGTEFDPIAGRGGTDGTPIRKTPWGEIAFQLGGATSE